VQDFWSIMEKIIRIMKIACLQEACWWRHLVMSPVFYSAQWVYIAQYHSFLTIRWLFIFKLFYKNKSAVGNDRALIT
jgi:hypothetical protein